MFPVVRYWLSDSSLTCLQCCGKHADLVPDGLYCTFASRDREPQANLSIWQVQTELPRKSLANCLFGLFLRIVSHIGCRQVALESLTKLAEGCPATSGTCTQELGEILVDSYSSPGQRERRPKGHKRVYAHKSVLDRLGYEAH